MSFTLEVGAISEEVKVTAEAPLLDTSSVSSGANFDTPPGRQPADVLEHADHAGALLVGREPERRAAAGVAGQRGQHEPWRARLGLAAAREHAVGSNNYTIDGANNNGSNRRLAISPNSDMIQEMRVESSNFDASVGHGSGLQVSMMTRAGTNTARGTVNYQYWTNRLNALTEQQKTTFDDRAKSEFEKGHSHNLSLTARRPRPHSRAGRRPRQAVLLRQLLARQRLDPRQAAGDDHGARPTRSTCRATSRTCCCCPIRRSTRSTIR